jgi:hypothetical protein
LAALAVFHARRLPDEVNGCKDWNERVGEE